MLFQPVPKPLLLGDAYAIADFSKVLARMRCDSIVVMQSNHFEIVECEQHCLFIKIPRASQTINAAF